LSFGSGFVVADNIVATNLHVIEGASAGFVRLAGVSNKYAIGGTVGVDQQHDLALLSISGLHASALTLATSQRASAGDEVYVIGNPEGLEGTISQGIVSGVREIDSGTLLQITAPISPGSSGGPVVNLRGEVIGLAVATLKVGQNLNFAVPSSYLSDLLGHKTQVKTFPITEPVERKTGRVKTTEEPVLSGVTASGFLWGNDSCGEGAVSNCGFSFTLRNEMQSTVESVRWIVIFYDSDGKPIDTYGDGTDIYYYRLKPGLAKRVAVDSRSGVDASVQRLTSRVEIRVLDFTLGSEGQ
jgi:hypothetical protein